MPLTQPKRDNPLMLGYFGRIGLSSMELARRCGVSHSQMMMARTRNVGHRNGVQISRGVAAMLGLSEKDRLYLLAEIRGHPGNLVWAYLGNPTRAAKKLEMDAHISRDILDPDRSVGDISGKRAVTKLRGMGAPEAVIEAVRSRIRNRPPGKRTHDLRGADMGRRRREARERLFQTKPLTARAIERAGLRRKDLQDQAGIGKETLREALYAHAGARTARKIIAALDASLSLSEEEREAIRSELLSDPRDS